MKLRLMHGAAGNIFMREILEAIAFEARAAGVDAETVDDVFPELEADMAYVVIPHEYFAVVPRQTWPSQEQLSRTIALTVEHPGTPWFDLSEVQARRCAVVFDINQDSTYALLRAGHDATHFQLGYTAAWDRWQGFDGDRPTDILYMGSKDDRRDEALSGYAQNWWDLNYRFLIPTNNPRSASTPGFLTGVQKYDLLRQSKVMLNIHRLDSRSLEWVRVIEAVSNGCVVVSEHSLDAAPLVASDHFFSAGLKGIGVLAKDILDHPEKLDKVRDSAYDFIRSAMPLAASVARLLVAAERLVTHRRAVPALNEVESPPVYDASRRPVPWGTPGTYHEVLGAGIRRLEGKLRQMEKEARLRTLGIKNPADAQTDEYVTWSYDAVVPKVSVVVPLYNHHNFIVEALESVLATTGVDYEVIIQDDGSTDASLKVAREFLEAHPYLPARLIHSAVNNGLAATRNFLLGHARGQYIFPLDADNGIYPTALKEFSDALDAAPEAPFAYAPIVAMRGGQPAGLVSAQPWDPEELRFGNYIDNMSMLRIRDVRELGGWDPQMFVWEDYHLWLRIAESGRAPIFIEKALTWYRMTGHSLRMEAGIDNATLWSRLREAAPTVLADEYRAVPSRAR